MSMSAQELEEIAARDAEDVIEQAVGRVSLPVRDLQRGLRG